MGKFTINGHAQYFSIVFYMFTRGYIDQPPSSHQGGSGQFSAGGARRSQRGGLRRSLRDPLQPPRSQTLGREGGEMRSVENHGESRELSNVNDRFFSKKCERQLESWRQMSSKFIVVWWKDRKILGPTLVHLCWKKRLSRVRSQAAG